MNKISPISDHTTIPATCPFCHRTFYITVGQINSMLMSDHWLKCPCNCTTLQIINGVLQFITLKNLLELQAKFKAKL